MKGQGNRGGGRRRGKAVREPSPTPSVRESSEQEEEEQQQQQAEEVPSAHGSDEAGRGEEEALDAFGSDGVQSVWQRGPAQLPMRLIPVEKRPLVRPTGKK